MQILFLASWLPYPPDNGSKIRTYHLLQALRRRHTVDVITFVNQADIHHIPSAAIACGIVQAVEKPVYHPSSRRAMLGYLSLQPRHVFDTYSPRMQRVVTQFLANRRYDAVVASQADTARYVPRQPGAVAIFEEVETSIIRDGYQQASSLVTRWRRWLTWQKTQRYMRELIGQFDACTVVSDLEKRNLRQVAPDYEPVHTIANGVDTDALRPEVAEPEPDTLIYNGALTYSANMDAMRHFLDSIWPHIRAAEPGASLSITGRTDGVPLRDLALDAQVHITGYLDDIRPAVARAWACVVPLRIGGGTRLKILEAMALGTPVVSTSKGAEGLDVTDGIDILIADDPHSFARQTVRLLHDVGLRQRLATNARRLVEAKYSWQTIGDQFAALVESAVRTKLSSQRSGSPTSQHHA